jgi:hypothetical protein
MHTLLSEGRWDVILAIEDIQKDNVDTPARSISAPTQALNHVGDAICFMHCEVVPTRRSSIS